MQPIQLSSLPLYRYIKRRLKPSPHGIICQKLVHPTTKKCTKVITMDAMVCAVALEGVPRRKGFGAIGTNIGMGVIGAFAPSWSGIRL